MKLNGYRPSHRNKWKFLKEGILTTQEFLLYEYILDQFDFDPSHEKFGMFELYLDEVSTVFNKQSGSVRSWLNGLLTKGFVEKTNRKYLFKLISPLKHINPGFQKGEAAQFAKLDKDQPIDLRILEKFANWIAQQSKNSFVIPQCVCECYNTAFKRQHRESFDN